MYIFLAYSFYALKYTKVDPEGELLFRVLINVLIAELLFWSGTSVMTFPDEFSGWNLVYFLLAQDVWMYTIHRMFHKIPYLYQFHRLHHSEYAPVYAWLAHPIDHIFINLASVGIPFMLFSNPYWTMVLLCMAQCRSSVTGHDNGTPHHMHHRDHTKQLGSIYLLDRILGSYK